MRRTFAAMAMLVWGCADEASVGSTRCTLASGCQALTIDAPLMLQSLSTANLPALAATWTDEGDIRFRLVGLASGGNGSLWTFTNEDGQLVGTRYDAEGTKVAEQRVSAPADIASVSVALRSTHSHALGPTVLAEWNQTCPPSADDGPLGPGGDCGRPELIVFSDDASTVPSRIDATPFYPDDQLVDGMYRSERGDALYLPTLNDGLISIDLQGNVLWRRALPRSLSEDNVRLYGTSKPDESSAFDVDGALLLNVNWYSRLDTGRVAWRGGLLRQPADGQPSTFLRYNLPSSGDLFEPAQGHENFYERDTRGRNWFVHRVEDGDLAVVRLDTAVADGYRLLREDYLDLRVGGTAMDPAGTLHVAFTAGGREPTAQRSVLCSFPLDGAPACSTILNGPGRMQAPAPGVVYIHGPGGFSRFDR